MLSFEDFFAKKNIDLTAFQAGEPALYKEFVLHYERMGEKSFDHSKKFWFNKLRKQYKRADDTAVISKKTVAPQSIPHTTLPSETVAESASVKPVGFKPRFKAATTANPEKEPTPTEKPQLEGEKPKGFTPKFRPKGAKPAEEANDSSEKISTPTPSTKSSEEPKKPSGFKPRFKAGVTKKSDEDSDAPVLDTTSQDHPAAGQLPTEEAPSKPKGFTPRFKAGVTHKADDVADQEKSAQGTTSQPTANRPFSDQNVDAGKPKGFKTRFKAGITKSADGVLSEEKPIPTNEPDSTETTNSDDAPHADSKPKGFTPRFKAGVTKKKPKDGD